MRIGGGNFLPLDCCRPGSSALQLVQALSLASPLSEMSSWQVRCPAKWSLGCVTTSANLFWWEDACLCLRFAHAAVSHHLLLKFHLGWPVGAIPAIFLQKRGWNETFVSWNHLELHSASRCKASLTETALTPCLLQNPTVYYCVKHDCTIKLNAIFGIPAWLYFWPGKTFRTHKWSEIISHPLLRCPPLLVSNAATKFLHILLYSPPVPFNPPEMMQKKGTKKKIIFF